MFSLSLQNPPFLRMLDIACRSSTSPTFSHAFRQSLYRSRSKAMVMHIISKRNHIALQSAVCVPKVFLDLMNRDLLTVVDICAFGNRHIIAFIKNNAYLFSFPFVFIGESRTLFSYFSPYTETQLSISINTAFKLWRHSLGEITDWCGG